MIQDKELKSILNPKNSSNECHICSKRTKFISIGSGYKKTCSKEYEMKLGKNTIEETKTDKEGTHSTEEIELNHKEELKIFVLDNLVNEYNRFEGQRLKDRHFEIKGKLNEYLMFKKYLNNRELKENLLLELNLTTKTNKVLGEFVGNITSKLQEKDHNGLSHYDRLTLKRQEKDENGLTPGNRLKLKRKEKDENGLDYYDRQFKIRYDDATKTKEDFVLYSWMCRTLTELQDLDSLENIEPRSKKYHLDHMFSISEGFKNNIPPRIIASLSNLTMLEGRNNLKKHSYCSITKEELFLSYFNS